MSSNWSKNFNNSKSSTSISLTPSPAKNTSLLLGFRICQKWMLKLSTANFSTAFNPWNNKNEPVVDYDNLDEYCIKIQGSAACIGACRMRKACSNLRKAIDDKSKDRCLSRLNEIKEEFHTLQIQLDPVLEDSNSGKTIGVAKQDGGLYFLNNGFTSESSSVGSFSMGFDCFSSGME